MRETERGGKRSREKGGTKRRREAIPERTTNRCKGPSLSWIEEET